MGCLDTPEGQSDVYLVGQLQHNGATTGMLTLNELGKYPEREREKKIVI